VWVVQEYRWQATTGQEISERGRRCGWRSGTSCKREERRESGRSEREGGGQAGVERRGSVKTFEVGAVQVEAD
jgi:hypothetical protein